LISGVDLSHREPEAGFLPSVLLAEE